MVSVVISFLLFFFTEIRNSWAFYRFFSSVRFQIYLKLKQQQFSRLSSACVWIDVRHSNVQSTCRSSVLAYGSLDLLVFFFIRFHFVRIQNDSCILSSSNELISTSQNHFLRSVCVWHLKDFLGDDQESPVFFSTLHRRLFWQRLESVDTEIIFFSFVLAKMKNMRWYVAVINEPD